MICCLTIPSFSIWNKTGAWWENWAKSWLGLIVISGCSLPFIRLAWTCAQHPSTVDINRNAIEGKCTIIVFALILFYITPSQFSQGGNKQNHPRPEFNRLNFQVSIDICLCGGKIVQGFFSDRIRLCLGIRFSAHHKAETLQVCVCYTPPKSWHFPIDRDHHVYRPTREKVGELMAEAAEKLETVPHHPSLNFVDLWLELIKPIDPFPNSHVFHGPC